MFCMRWLPWWIEILIILISAVIAAYLYATWTHNIFIKMGIPGPKPGFLGMLPLYGEKAMIHLDTEFTHKYGRVAGIFHGRHPAILVSDTDMIKQIFVEDFSKFVNRNKYVPSINLMKKSVDNVINAEWKYQRSVISPTFSSGKMREMCSLISVCTDNQVKKFAAKLDPQKAIMIDEINKCYTMDAIAATCFGLDVDSQNNPDNLFLRHASKGLFSFSLSRTLIVLCMMFPVLTDICDYLNIGYVNKDTVEYFSTIVYQAIDERRQESVQKRDFLQLMLNAHKEKNPNSERGLTEDEILANSLFFMMAGFDTTSLTISYCLLCLALNPHIQEKLVADIDKQLGKERPDYDNIRDLVYLDLVISETLRLFPPAPRLNRKATCDAEVNGYNIPKGMAVMVPLYTIQRDPEYWEDPDVFDPERFSAENKHKINPYAYLPFGTGPRNCVGLRLANLMIKVALVTLLQNFRFIQTPETEVNPEFAKGGFVRPVNGIWLKLENR